MGMRIVYPLTTKVVKLLCNAGCFHYLSVGHNCAIVSIKNPLDDAGHAFIENTLLGAVVKDFIEFKVEHIIFAW